MAQTEQTSVEVSGCHVVPPQNWTLSPAISTTNLTCNSSLISPLHSGTGSLVDSGFSSFSTNSVHAYRDKQTREHLKKVYSCLALGLLAAAVGAYVHVFTDVLKGNFLTSLGSIAVLLLLWSTPDNGNNEKLRFGYFLGFGALSGLGTGPLLDMAMRIDPAIIMSAFMGTCLIFGCFTLAALYAPDRKFLYLGGMLMSAMSAMFWMTILNLFMGSRLLFQLNLYVGLVVICLFVLYDTQLIMEKRRMGDTDYIWHSVDLFIDFMDIFRRLLIILSQKESNKKRKD